MDLLGLIGLGTSAFGSVSNAVEDGSSAAKSNKSLQKMRSVEVIGGGLIIAVGCVVTFLTREWWPLLTSFGLAGVMIGLREWMTTVA